MGFEENNVAAITVPAGAPVLMCSGQGAQKPGMGADLLDVAPVAAAFACASDVLGFSVADAVCDTDPATLADTRRAQPALCALSVGIGRALMERGVQPGAVLGFSLGQVAALALSGMLSDEATFSLVKVRSELMAEAAEAAPGAMSAFLKASPAEVAEVCDECAQGSVLVPANFNCPRQIVVSGAADAVARAEEAWAARGKRCSRLSTAGAFHSPLMAPAAEQFRSYLEGVEFAQPRIPLVCNVDAAPLTAADARDHLVRHLTGPVLFEQSVQALSAGGATTFIEVGFGGVLTGLVRRINKDAERVCVQDRTSMDSYCSAFQTS